jgi:hypothetical protein
MLPQGSPPGVRECVRNGYESRTFRSSRNVRRMRRTLRGTVSLEAETG